MAINAYTGLMGSGKSYEVVSEIIVPAIEDGRRVVTNVEGINEEKIHEYLKAKKRPPKLEAGYGKVVHVTNDQVHDANFFYTGEENKSGVESIVQPGDLVAIDEAWRFFGTGQKVHDNVMIFLREHRHFTHPETGTSCDLVVMTQDVGDLVKQIKHVIEMTTRTVKHKKIGLSKGYRIEIYEGYRIARGSFITQKQKLYNKEIFPLYQSYKTGNGKEVVLDDRQNLLKQPKIWLMLGAVPVFLGVSIYMAMGLKDKYFPSGGMAKAEADKKAAAAKAAGTTVPTTIGADGRPVATQTTSGTAGMPPGATKAHVEPPKPEFSTSKRYVGTYSIGGAEMVIINENGRMRFATPAQGHIDGMKSVFLIDGEKVTTFSGGGGETKGGTTTWAK